MTGTCLHRCATQICEDLCHSETQICGPLDLWVTQTRAHPYTILTVWYVPVPIACTVSTGTGAVCKIVVISQKFLIKYYEYSFDYLIIMNQIRLTLLLSIPYGLFLTGHRLMGTC